MARRQDEPKYARNKQRLLDAGLKLFIRQSFGSTGLNDILKSAGLPKGSFYHYFDTKEAFGLAVVDHYHHTQTDMLRSVLLDTTLAPRDRILKLIDSMIHYYRELEFSEGCLLGNFSLELADSHPSFRERLQLRCAEQCAVFEQCLEGATSEIGLGHLTPIEAAQFVFHGFEGALMRMKVERNEGPLKLLRLALGGDHATS